MKRTRKTTATRNQIIKIRERIKQFNSTTAAKSKKIIIPGPYTNLETPLQVKVLLRPSKSIDDNEILGTYPEPIQWNERGWYPIYFNLIAPDITKIVKQFGINAFLAACEKDLNNPDNKKRFGRIVIIRVVVDHSLEEQERAEKDRFVSCYAKTTNKSIDGFWTMRKGQFVIIGKIKNNGLEELNNQ
jgi:hypothetical protein